MKTATSRQSFEEARLPGESQVSYNKKVKFRLSVTDIRELGGHNGRVLKAGNEIKESTEPLQR